MGLSVFTNKPQDNSDELMFAELVKLLAEEDIVTIIDPSFTTASFDLQRRIIMIPTWEKMNKSVKSMLRFHECSHALFSDVDNFHDFIKGKYSRVLCGIINICEDDRVDRMMIRRFPGARAIYAEGYKYVANKFFEKMDIETLTLADRFNLDSKAKFAHPFVAKNAQETELYVRFKTTSTVQEVIELAKDILEYCRENNQAQQPQTDQGPTQDSDEQDDNSDEGNMSDQNDQEKSENSNPSDSKGDASDSQEGEQSDSNEDGSDQDSEGTEGESSENGKESNSKKEPNGGSNGGQNEENFSKTQDLFDQQEAAERADASQNAPKYKDKYGRTRDLMDEVTILRAPSNRVVGYKQTRQLISNTIKHLR